MGLLDQAVEIPRKTMILFFVVDVSGSMDGDKIASLNDGIREVIPDIREISANNADAIIKVAILSFSSGAQWLTPMPADLENFNWIDLEADGVTDLGEACRELNSKLSKDAFLQDAVGNFAPVILLFSDGGPTDDYEQSLSELKQNKWFKAGIKIAFAIGDDADKNVLAEFTGNKETVLSIMNKSMMKRMIRFVSVTSSKIGSKKAGSNGGAVSKQEEVAAAIQSEVQEISPEEMIDEGW